MLWWRVILVVVVPLIIGAVGIVWTAIAAAKLAKLRGNRPRCAGCGYSVSGLSVSTCPECGAKLATDGAVFLGIEPKIVRWRVGAAALVWSLGLVVVYSASFWAIGTYFPSPNAYSGTLKLQAAPTSVDVLSLSFDGVSSSPASPAQRITLSFHPTGQTAPAPNAPTLTIDPALPPSQAELESWLRTSGYPGDTLSLPVDAALVVEAIASLGISTTSIAAGGSSIFISGSKLPSRFTVLLVNFSILVAIFIWVYGLRRLASGRSLSWLHQPGPARERNNA
ncbi:MAG: hypothetical protein NTV94_02025 [Planctomycetota bacterium]|nr:hypothetical protein [Planctomycetota bacterium]